MFDQYYFDGKEEFKISKAKTDDKSLCEDRETAEKKLAENNLKIDELQKRLYADKKEGVIFLFQAMDAAGKDGTIRAVLQCLSPHGVNEAAFKAPNSTELAHDFLWRIEQQVPAKGEIAIFNRSQYEDVLIGKVKKLYQKQDHAKRIDEDKIIENRYEDIRNYEQYLYHNSVRTVKIFLNVSRDEQARRFLARIEEPEKNWKFSESDWSERQYWDDYMQAFEDAINATATKNSPWYVIPADRKWYARYVVSEIILATLQDMAPEYPEVTSERLETFQGLRQQIIAELPEDDEALMSIEQKAAKEAAKAAKKAAKKAEKDAEKAARKAEKKAAKKAKKADTAEKSEGKAGKKDKKEKKDKHRKDLVGI